MSLPEGDMSLPEGDMSLACHFCVSGPPLCSCSMAGECEVLGENFIDVEGRVDSEGDCYDICNKTDGCNVFTYLGEGNHLRNYSASSSDIKISLSGTLVISSTPVISSPTTVSAAPLGF